MSSTTDDLDDIALVRGLRDAARTRLERAITGDQDGRRNGNPDLPLWIASRALLALAHLSPAADAPSARDLIETILSAALARRGALSNRLAGRTADVGGARLRAEASGLHLDLASGPFSLTWRQVTDALALIHFLMTADAALQWPDVTAALAPLVSPQAGAGPALSAATTALSAVRRRYEGLHFELEVARRRASALADHVFAARGGTNLEAPLADAEILAFWLAGLDSGTCIHFVTAAHHAVALERIRAEQRGRERLRATVTLDDPHTGAERARLPWANFAGSSHPDDAGSIPAGIDRPPSADDDMPWPEDLLDRLPEEPKVLTDKAQTTLRRLFLLHPLQHGRQRTVLRALSFGQVQNGHTARAQFGSDAAIRPPEPYPALRAEHLKLRRGLTRMLAEAYALRRQFAEPDETDADDTDADADADVRAPVLPRARPLRRASLDDAPAARAAQFATFDETLASIAGCLDTFLPSRKAAPSGDEGFAEDAPIFLAAFARLYRS